MCVIERQIDGILIKTDNSLQGLTGSVTEVVTNNSGLDWNTPLEEAVIYF